MHFVNEAWGSHTSFQARTVLQLGADQVPRVTDLYPPTAGENRWAGESDYHCPACMNSPNNVHVMAPLGHPGCFWKPEPCSLHREERMGSCLAAGRNTAPATTTLLLLPAFKSHQPSCSTLNRQL